VLLMENFRSKLIWNTLRNNEKVSMALDLIFSEPVNMFDVTVHNISDDVIVNELSFGSHPLGTEFALGDQYILVDYILSSPGTIITAFTDNTNNPNFPYTGTGNAAGMVGHTDPTQAAPFRWVVFEDKENEAYPFMGDPNEAITQDKSMVGFFELDAINDRTLVDQQGNLAQYPEPNRQTNQDRIFVYFGVDYRGQDAQDYSTETLTFEINQT